MVGVDGVCSYGSHLEGVVAGVAPGARVRAGRLLGRVGNSGSARGTAVHLHFGISWSTRPGVWWVRRGRLPVAVPGLLAGRRELVARPGGAGGGRPRGLAVPGPLPATHSSLQPCHYDTFSEY
jgi:murein DD-endopeptidase MepM/ murein hydrolase activator NlpD